MGLLAGLLLILVAGFVPMIFYSTVMWWVDRYEKEPWWLLVLTFLWGAVPSIILALIGQLVGGSVLGARDGSIGDALVMASILAPLTEEIAKGLAVVGIFLFFRREIDSLLDGVVYGSLVGFGFAATENVFYFLGAWSEGGIGSMLVLAFLRAVVFGLNHAFFSSLFGMGMALARHGQSTTARVGGPIFGLAGAMLFHGLHNLGASLAGQSLGWIGMSFAVDWLGIAGVFGIVLWTLGHERRWIRTMLSEEADLGRLTTAEIAVLASSWKRFGNLWRAATGGGRVPRAKLAAFYHDATELAFLKRHQRVLADDPDAARKIEELRARIAEARRDGPLA